MNFLNIDLDFFIRDGIVHCPRGKVRRAGRQYKSWTPKELEFFLERQCGLSTKKPIPGRFGKHHDAVFNYWHELQSTYTASPRPFKLTHVDAHADLGFGDSSWKHLCTEWLNQPIAARINPKRGNDGLNLGSYIPYAIASGWISSIEFITHPDWDYDDLPPLLFKNYDVKSNVIQLKKFAESSVDTTLKVIHFFDAMEQRTLTPLSVEPDVAFNPISYNSWVASSNFDYAFLAQSPNYTPASADKLIGVFCRYIDFQ